MKTENWIIDYDLQTSKGVVHVKENLPCRRGYHERFVKFKVQGNFRPGDDSPIYKVRDKNYVELLGLGGFAGGRNLPLEKKAEFVGAELIADEEHPIVLTSPTGVRYTKREF